mgnify:CR=1 FL=1
MSQTYHEQIDYKNTMKLRELQKELPAFLFLFPADNQFLLP